jgi:hypothetical protein
MKGNPLEAVDYLGVIFGIGGALKITSAELDEKFLRKIMSDTNVELKNALCDLQKNQR